MAIKGIKFLPQARKSLAKLEKSNPAAARVVLAHIEMLEKEPSPPKAGAVQGTKYMRIPAGDYRVFYAVRNDIIAIAHIGKRNDNEAYRELKRRAK